MTAHPADGRSPRLRLLAVVLILAVTAFRGLYLLFFCPYDLAPDEGHYWDWSRHLDWSYYSKGPLVAWVIRAGCELFGELALACDGTLMPAVRLPAVLCGAGTLAALYTLTYQTYRSDRLALGVVVVILSLPSFLALSVVMTIDAPFLCCWAWALVFGRWAMVDGKAWAWPAAGVAIALGILAKYTMALGLASAGLFLLFTPTHRRLLFRPGFWVMSATAGLSAIPILIWNAANDWVTFRHVAVQAGVAQSPKNTGFRPEGPFVYVGEQFLPLFGFWFVLWLLAVARFRPTQTADPGVRYVWWTSVPTFALFGVASLATKVQVNWPVAAYLSGAVLIGGWFAEVGRHKRSVRIGAWIAVGIGVLVSVVAHDTSRFFVPAVRPFLKPETSDQPTPVRKLDVAARLKGWKYLCEHLDRQRAELEANGEVPLIAANRWDVPGTIGFYCAGHPQAYSFGLMMKDRHSQYELWHPNPITDAQEFRGRTFLVVAAGYPAAELRPAFESVGPPHEVVYRENGLAVATWTVCVARGFKGFDPSARPGPASH
jgi:hypothetical protein